MKEPGPDGKSDVSPSLPQPVQAVLDEALGWRERFPGSMQLGGNASRSLADAVDAYRATIKPQAVRPEEAELGTRFRFADPKAALFEERTLRLVFIYDPGRDERTTAWLIEETGMVSKFFGEDRIIPILPEAK